MARRRHAAGSVRNSLLVLLTGLALGVLSKWSDHHAPLLAELTSGITLWILLASAAARYSRTPWRAALHVLLLLGGMVCAYYASAEAMGGVWSRTFFLGWGAAALLSPLSGFLVWHARGGSFRAWAIRLGVIAFQALAAALLFERLRVSDMLMILLTAAVLLSDTKTICTKGVDHHGR